MASHGRLAAIASQVVADKVAKHSSQSEAGPIYRVAILGCRGRGTSAARGYAAHPRCEIVGLCDLVPEVPTPAETFLFSCHSHHTSLMPGSFVGAGAE
jgi:hypothetical protein